MPLEALPPDGASVATRALISGVVQGVWFRQSTKQEADRLGVVGWVRNLEDGRVEAVIQGPEEAVAALVAWCQHGPEQARVDRVVTEAIARAGPFTEFTVRR